MTHATSRSVGVPQGNIDREAVAKTINAHLQEVRGCYERALLKDPGLAGKVVLEWTIGTRWAVSDLYEDELLQDPTVESRVLSMVEDGVCVWPERFCLTDEAVSTVIPGMRTRRHVEANCALSGQGPLDAGTMAILRRHAWGKNFYQ